MGRPDKPAPPQWQGKACMTRVRLNQGGYDDGGSYWGVGEPLYYASADDGMWNHYIRAEDRAEAKLVIRTLHPGVRFYR